jgi:hypothetical protein
VPPKPAAAARPVPPLPRSANGTVAPPPAAKPARPVPVPAPAPQREEAPPVAIPVAAQAVPVAQVAPPPERQSILQRLGPVGIVLLAIMAGAIAWLASPFLQSLVKSLTGK